MSGLIWDQVIKKIDALVISAVETEESDFPKIIKLREKLAEVVKQTMATSYPQISQIGKKAAEITQKIILQESEDIEYDLNTVIETCSTLQCMVREILNGRDPYSIPLPYGLELNETILRTVYNGSTEEKYIANISDNKIPLAVAPSKTNDDDLNAFLSEMKNLFEISENCILALENEPNNREHLQSLVRVFRTFKEHAEQFNIDSMAAVAQVVENLTNQIDALTPEIANLLFGAIDCFKEIEFSLDHYVMNKNFSNITNPYKLIQEFEIYASELNQQNTVKSVGHKAEKTEKMLKEDILKTIEQDFSPQVTLEQLSTPVKKNDELAKTIHGNCSIQHIAEDVQNNSLMEMVTKLSLSELNELIDTVDELSISFSMLESDDKISKIADVNIQKKIILCNKLIHRLEKETQKVRTIPINSMFEHMKEVGQSLAHKLGKDILIHTSGESTLLSRRTLELAYDPLIRLLKNAAEHGIEAIQDRINKDKTSVANIFLRAYKKKSSICIEIEDDGGGISVGKMMNKAISLGLLSENGDVKKKFPTERISMEEPDSGSSLHIIRQKIESLNGKVSVITNVGTGTKFIVTLPG